MSAFARAIPILVTLVVGAPFLCSEQLDPNEGESWTVEFPFLRESCERAAISLELFDQDGDHVSSLRTLLDGDTVWFLPDLVEGSYEVVPEVTDCDGDTVTLAPLRLRVSADERRRVLYFATKSEAREFKVLHASSCSTVEGGGELRRVGTRLVFTNTSAHALTPCGIKEPIGLYAILGRERIELADVEWPEDPRVEILPLERIEIEFPSNVVAPESVATGEGELELEIGLRACQFEATDYGWSSLSRTPYTLTPCCNSIGFDASGLFELQEPSQSLKCSSEDAESYSVVTSRHIRLIWNELEKSAAESGRFPDTEGRLLDAGSLAQLRSVLQSRDLSRDYWQEPIFLWSDGDSAIVVAKGCDREFDHDYTILTTGVTVEAMKAELCRGQGTFDSDLVLVEGGYCTWPVGL